MSRRQDNDPAAGPQVSGGPPELSAVVFNVFEDIDIDNSVELFRCGQAFQSSTDRLVLTRLTSKLIFKLSNKLAVRFHADEPFQMTIVQVGGVASNAGAGLQDIPRHKAAY